jgi:tetratricopeptide (TPR) repeat protein
MNQFMQLGQAAVQQKNFEQAIQWFAKAAAENPKDPQIKACLGQSFCWLGKLDEGISHLRQSGQLLLKKARKTRDIELALDLVDQLQHWGDYPGAVEVCKQAAQINPRTVRAFQLLALSHSRLNQKKAALLAGRQALKLAPDNMMLVILLATLEAGDGLVQDAKRRLDKVLQNPLLKPEEKFRAHKEQARFLDKLGDYQQVFAHLDASAEIAPHLPEVKSLDMSLVPKMLDINKAEFDTDLLGCWSNTEFPAEQAAPVFLLGFMRTGTTLTQEVLGAHPDVFVADETDLIMSVVKELARMSSGQGSIPQQLRRLDLDGVLHLRRFYWDRANALYGEKIGKRLLLDKTTMNTIDLGLINCVFPDAKLIFLIRDPRDVCLSCILQTMRPNSSTVHLIDWQNTARFYAKVMDWWMHVKPRLTMDVLEFRYEDAVFEFEPAFRKVFDFLGLSWDASVADFHKNAAGKYIASPSFSQVAQPLYSSSVGRWKHYETEYRGINQYLEPYITAFGYD